MKAVYGTLLINYYNICYFLKQTSQLFENISVFRLTESSTFFLSIKGFLINIADLNVLILLLH